MQRKETNQIELRWNKHSALEVSEALQAIAVLVDKYSGQWEQVQYDLMPGYAALRIPVEGDYG